MPIRTLKLQTAFFLLLSLVLPLSLAAQGADWPEWRGPNRDGISAEKNLPEKWTLNGQNFLWRVPIGGRSAPVVWGNHVYLVNSSGQGEHLQERVMCLDANTGKTLWEQKFNVFLSDVPPHRTGWGSPAVDPETENVYALGVGGMLVAFTKDGKPLWERALTEEFGLLTTHGGRTVSPLIDGNLVIISGASFGWGANAGGSHRFYAFDKRTGESVWVSQPGGRPYDTAYSGLLITNVNGTRLLVSGAGDGFVHALKPQTGEPVWKVELSKRGINTAVVMIGNEAIVSHSEENMDTSEMGLLAAVDGTSQGTIPLANLRWAIKGVQVGYSSPVTDGRLIYQVDNGANLLAFEAKTGTQVWSQNLGAVQKASLVMGDGKLYVGTESGKFFILRPRADGCDILDQDLLGTEEEPEIVTASAAISRGRIFFVSETAAYAFGKRVPDSAISRRAVARAQTPGTGDPAFVQVVPADILLAPGQTTRYRARLFNAQGEFLREAPAAWSLDRVSGEIKSADGTFTAGGNTPQAGQVVATVGNLKGTGAVRIIPPLPWSEDFSSVPVDRAPAHWTNTTLKYFVREVDGNKMLVKRADNPFSFIKRARGYMGPTDLHDYTVQADIMATLRRRMMGDVGIVAQRYQLALFGVHQRLELQSWQPETERTVTVPFAWKPDVWYTMKLRVENLPDGAVRARGKVWVRGEPEPEAWVIEKVDRLPNRKGSPGIYGDAPSHQQNPALRAEIFYDNIKVTPNR
jgi:outer membrane protein assembly factor BamB